MTAAGPAAPDKVLLLGMMGAGKTTVGAALSARTGWPYLDNDVLLRRATGGSGPALLAERGSDGLAAAEADVVTLLLGMPGPLVGALPGGCVLDPGTLARLEGCGLPVVWLRASVTTLAARVGAGEGRARLGHDARTVRAAITALARDREPLYARLARLTIDVDDLPADVAAARVADALGLPRAS